MLALAKSVTLGPSLALLGSKYKRPSGEENKNPNNLKVTVLKQASKNLLPGKFSENRFFLSCIGIDRFHCHAIKKINRKLSSGYSQEIVILLEINKQDPSPSFRSVRFPTPQIFVEMFRRNLQSSVWKRHVGAHQMCTNMAAGK